MVEWHMKSKRKSSGGLNRALKRCDKRLVWRGGEPALTSITKGEKPANIERKKGRGHEEKIKAKAVKYANITDRNSKKIEKAEIISVAENRANRLFTRRNIITKGAIIKAKLGGNEVHALVTSRPGQSGVVNAVLTEIKAGQKKAQKKARPKREAAGVQEAEKPKEAKGENEQDTEK